MLKEIVIIITIIVVIFIGNTITQKYTTQAIEEMTNILNSVRQEIFESKENIDVNKIEEEIENINTQWENKHEKLAYYIEHDELEKVETNLTGLKGEIEAKEYGDAMSRLDQSVFLLEHIEDKYAFNLQNVF